jgi:hypothetical protein
LSIVKTFDGACFLSSQMTTLHQLKRIDVGRENAHFQSIVKSFALEHLVKAALSGSSLCCRLGLVRLLQTVPREKMTRFALMGCNIAQPAVHHLDGSSHAQAVITR